MHSGEEVYLTLKPAPINTGIVFVRTDLHPVVKINGHARAVGSTNLQRIQRNFFLLEIDEENGDFLLVENFSRNVFAILSHHLYLLAKNAKIHSTQDRIKYNLECV